MSEPSDHPQDPFDERAERRAARRDRPRGSSGALFAVALIVLGGAALMTNMGIAHVNWLEAARYWPVLLILFGLDMMIGRRTLLGSSVMAVVTVAALLGVFWLAGRAPAEATPPSFNLFGGAQPATGTIEKQLGGAKKLKVEVHLTDMALNLGALDAGNDGLAAQGTWQTRPGLEPETTYTVDGDTGLLTIRQPDSVGLQPFVFESRMKLSLPPNIPIDLTVQSSLGSVTLDLSSLQATALDASADSGSLTVTLPDAGEMQTVKVHGNLGSVTLKAPDKATLNIQTLDASASSGSLTVGLPAEGTIDTLTVQGDLGSVTASVPDDSTLQLGDVTFKSNSGSLTVGLPAKGKAGSVSLNCNLGSITLNIPGSTNTLSVEKLDVNANSGSVTVTLPGGKGNYPASIQSDLGGITVFLPASLDANINIDAGLSKPTVSSERLKQIGDQDWKTANYDQGDNRALVTIQASSGGVTVKDQ